MGVSDFVWTQKNGSLFIQPYGPGTQLYWLGCHDADDLEAPKGEIEIEQSRDANGAYYVIGQRKGPPEPVTTTITGLHKKTRDWLEKLQCSNAALYLMLMTCARMDNPAAWNRVKVLQHINISSVTYANLLHHLEENTSTHAMDIQAWPPLIEAVQSVIDRVAVVETQALNDVWTDPVGRCSGDCGDTIIPGDVAGVACDSAAGPATGNILFATDGQTFAAGAADPFGAGLHTAAIAAFPINASGRRWLVGKQAVGGAQGQVAYSDDAGATWTVVAVGGAAAGHGPTYGGGIWAPNGSFIVMAGAAGYIYKSIDRGETWSAVESGVVTAGAYAQVHFSDDKHGAAVAAAGVVALTRDGGETWYAGTVIGGGAAGNLCVHVFDDKRIQVGDDAGKLWQSTDFGETWSQVTGWTGSGAGDVRDIDYANDFVGFMAHNTVAPVGSILRTVDGGANWVVMSDIPANAGLNAVAAVDENTCYAAGEAQGGTGVLLKISEA